MDTKDESVGCILQQLQQFRRRTATKRPRPSVDASISSSAENKAPCASNASVPESAGSIATAEIEYRTHPAVPELAADQHDKVCGASSTDNLTCSCGADLPAHDWVASAVNEVRSLYGMLAT